MTTPVTPKATLAAYTPDELTAIVALRCQELSAHLGWPVKPPAVRVVDPEGLQIAMRADVRARGEKARGTTAPEEGLLETLAGWLLGMIGPTVLGYFGTTEDTLFLNGELAPQQAGYVLVHELTHAAQWQNFPALFARVDASRAETEDLIDRDGPDAPATKAARDRYESLVTFVEGHATLHGRRVCEARLRRDAPQVSEAEAAAFVAALTGLDPADENVALIYVRGERALAGMDAAQVEAMFREPERAERLFARGAA